jgi:hypothetical protein
MGIPLSERPPLQTEADRLAIIEAKKAAKDARKGANGRWISQQRTEERERQRELIRRETQKQAMKAFAEIVPEQQRRLRETQLASSAAKVANKAQMVALRKARLRRLLAKSREALKNPNITAESRQACEKIEANALAGLKNLFQIIKKTAPRTRAPVDTPSPASNTTAPLPLDTLLQLTEEKMGTAKAAISYFEKELLELNTGGSLPRGVVKTEKEKKLLKLKTQKETLLTALELKQSRLKLYLEEVEGREHIYATKAGSWKVLVGRLHLTVEEKISAVSTLASMPGVEFGSHIKQWNPSTIAAYRAERAEKVRAKARHADVDSFEADNAKASIDIGEQTSEAQNKSKNEAATEQRDGPDKKGVLGNWLKW